MNKDNPCLSVEYPFFDIKCKNCDKPIPVNAINLVPGAWYGFQCTCGDVTNMKAFTIKNKRENNKLMNNLNICVICDKRYDPKETKRIFGDMHWTHDQCSAQCHTKYIMTLNFFIEEIEETLTFSDVDLSKGEIHAIAKEKTDKLLKILR